MKFTRETGIVRQLVSVINPKAIPDHVDHTFDGEGYVIPVEVEGNEDLVMEEANEVDDDSRDNGNGNSKEGLGHDDDSHSNVKSNQKVQKTSDSGVAKEGADVNALLVASLPFSLQVGQIECTSPPRIPDRSPVVTSCEPVPFGINTPSKVGAAHEGNHTNSGPRKSWFDMVQEDEAAERLTASAPPAVNHKVISPTTVPLDRSVAAVTNQATRPTQLSGTTSASPSHGPRGTGVFLGGRYTQAEVVAFGGIPPAAAAGVRSSERIRSQPMADATQMERAQLLAQARDMGEFSGYSIGHALDPYVVFSPAGGPKTGHGFWVHPLGDGSMGFV